MSIDHSGLKDWSLMSADTLFKSQLEVIKNAISMNCYIIGNFNLDARMEYRDDFYKKCI